MGNLADPSKQERLDVEDALCDAGTLRLNQSGSNNTAVPPALPGQQKFDIFGSRPTMKVVMARHQTRGPIGKAEYEKRRQTNAIGQTGGGVRVRAFQWNILGG